MNAATGLQYFGDETECSPLRPRLATHLSEKGEGEYYYEDKNDESGKKYEEDG